MHSSCKHRLCENLIQDLKLIDNNYKKKQWSQRKETSAKPATTAPPKGPEEKTTASKPTDNDVPKIPGGKKKPDKLQADLKKPPKDDPINMLSRGQCPACEKSFKSPLQHIQKSKCKGQVSPKVIVEFEAIPKEQKQRSQKKETSAKPATTAPPKGPEEKITAPKSTNNDFLKIPTEKKKPDKIQADSNQPPEQSSDADPPPTQSIR